MIRTAAPLALVLLASAGIAVAQEARKPVVLVDFETGEPTDGWKAEGVGLIETTAPAGKTPSGGRALGLKGKKGGYVIRQIDVNDWRGFAALSFHCRVDAPQPLAMRIMAAEATSFRSQLRRFELQPGDWREVTLPLAEFRWDLRRPPGRFDRIGRVVLQWDKGAGTVVIDDVRLIPGDRGLQSHRPTDAAQLALAFPDGTGRSFSSKSFLLVTNAGALGEKEAATLLERAEAGLELLKARYRVPGTMAGRAPLAVFATKKGYHDFFKRLGDHLGAGITPPSADGYSALGWAGSTWDPKQGAGRPVYVHEAMHAALEQLLPLSSDGNWIQEALANAVQAKLHPASMKADLADLFARRARGENVFVPFGSLVAMKRPGVPRYVQLMTVAEFLATKHADALPVFWERVTSSWKQPHDYGRLALEIALRRPIESIGAEWVAWGAAHYAK